MIPRLVVVLDAAGARLPIEQVAVDALAGGADIVQIREKGRPMSEVKVLVRRVIDCVGGPEHISINSFPKLATTEGLHLHLADGFRSSLRSSALAPGRMLSRSFHDGFDPQELLAADYYILGNLFDTGSKAGLPGLGSERFKEAVVLVKRPVLAIGGIDPGNVREAMESGAYGVAVRSFIIGSDDPRRTTALIRAEIDTWISNQPAATPA